MEYYKDFFNIDYTLNTFWGLRVTSRIATRLSTNLARTSSHLTNFSPSCRALGTSIGFRDTFASLAAVLIVNITTQLRGDCNTVVDESLHLPPRPQSQSPISGSQFHTVKARSTDSDTTQTWPIHTKVSSPANSGYSPIKNYN